MSTPTRPARKGLERPSSVADCQIRSCGRRAYAKGLCQTHHRQLLTAGTFKPIRAYRPRSPGTIKFSGLRVQARSAEEISEYATRKGLSLGGAIAAILEEWCVRSRKPLSLPRQSLPPLFNPRGR